MITVSIVEDDHDVRESLALLIDSAPGFACIGTFPDCESALDGIPVHPPDVVLMDLALPGLSGIEGIRRLRALCPGLDIVVLTIHENDNMVFQALCAGACGYLIKSEDPDRLLDALREVHDGGAPMSTRIARMVVGSFRVRTPSALTPRETEVLSELCTGKSYKMIADALIISEETVRRHLKNIYKKLEVHSKSEAVAKALQERLIS
jgi:DNA-binding NarL/FixJ family response regulator